MMFINAGMNLSIL
uniref:Uncharacterized protein n=1 Tax=Anguilla anguilla TaxID=7936 RepID=A0A0E9TVB2_ANGAN